MLKLCQTIANCTILTLNIMNSENIVHINSEGFNNISS